MKSRVDIKIKKEIRQKLKILCTVKGYSSYDELIEDMLKTYCEKEGIEISIKLNS